MTQPTPPTPPQPGMLPGNLPPQPLPPPVSVGAPAQGEIALAPPPEEYYRPEGFWQRPWVQDVLPFITSLTLHAVIIIVVVAAVIAAPDVIQKIKPLEAQLTSADSAIVDQGPLGGVANVGIGGDPTRPAAQDEYAEGGDGWAPKPGDKSAVAALMGSGDGESSDAVIGLSAVGGGFGRGTGVGSGAGEGRGSGAGDGRGPLAPFGTPGGGGIGNRGNLMGVKAGAQTIVYVCDASGSMINTFASLKEQLTRSIQGLKSVQGFNVIFFQDEKCVALNDGLLFATPENKRKAFKWLDDQTTTGTTNPIPGLEMAFKNRPQLIYMLTDADFPDNNAVKTAVQRMNTGKQTRINTIIFVPGDDDADASASFKELMKEIAQDNGGVFAYVKESELQ